VVHGVALGTATITATVSGQSGSTVVTVGPGAILTVSSVTPAANALSVGIEGSIKITFSEPINASTATASNVRVAVGAATVAGTIAVAGNVITVTPTAPLTEFNTVYTVAVTPGVLSTTGNYLAANQSSTFTTTFLDPSYYYRITNELQGPSKALDTFSNTFACFMGISAISKGNTGTPSPSSAKLGTTSFETCFSSTPGSSTEPRHRVVAVSLRLQPADRFPQDKRGRSYPMGLPTRRAIGCKTSRSARVNRWMRPPRLTGDSRFRSCRRRLRR